jgi:CDGSH-type Zn-finger protein
MNPKIRCANNGPLIVEGLTSLTRIGSDTTYETKDKIALCRCGQSENKPFCDGSHAAAGFSDEKQPDRTADRRRDYVGERVTIHDNRGICAHAAICTDRLASVFRYGQEPWIDPDGASVDEIAEIVRACPSGALGYSIDGVEQRVADDGEPRILVAPGGPYAVKGKVELVDQDWGEGASRDRYDLCRCGQSKNKPFCDGSHWNTEFDEDAKTG